MIIWIASYPKSGNTWVRYFLKSYSEQKDKKLSLKSTKNDNFFTLNFPNLSLLKELGIEYKNFSFGMDIKEPDTENHFMADKLTKDDRDLLWEIHQLSKQFKYIDKETKIVFVRNRIPRTLMKSKIKPKASLIALGGGYYTSGTDNLKRLLDNLPKKLYYNDHQPSNFDWHEKLIMKL